VINISKIKGLNLKEKCVDKPNLGIIMMIIATICFSLMAVMIKFLCGFPVMELVFFRNIPIMLIIPLILKSKKSLFGGIIGLFYYFAIFFPFLL
jgi:ABC-type tungstate transport system substrate-binding protein